jgi:hypothetical protein
VKSGKRISQIHCAAKEGYIFWQRGVAKMCKKSCQKEIQEKGYLSKDYANNLYQRKFYETPLYGQVRSDKQDGDKG